jgi:hypothetical protein
MKLSNFTSDLTDEEIINLFNNFNLNDYKIKKILISSSNDTVEKFNDNINKEVFFIKWLNDNLSNNLNWCLKNNIKYYTISKEHYFYFHHQQFNDENYPRISHILYLLYKHLIKLNFNVSFNNNNVYIKL